LPGRSLLFAGYDATAMSLCFMMLEIARHANVQAKLRSEIRQKARDIRERGDVEFTANDFDNMSYLNAVIKVGFLKL
jgi:cytochrome P450